MRSAMICDGVLEPCDEYPPMSVESLLQSHTSCCTTFCQECFSKSSAHPASLLYSIRAYALKRCQRHLGTYITAGDPRRDANGSWLHHVAMSRLLGSSSCPTDPGNFCTEGL